MMLSTHLAARSQPSPLHLSVFLKLLAKYSF
jgi:hypothetical protein